MKVALVAVAFSLALGGRALAQAADSQNAPGSGDSIASHARAMHQARAAVLAVLSPEHRASVGRIIGTFAVATTADFDDAARQIDGALSPSERTTVLAAAQPVRDQLHLVHYNPGGPMIPVGGTPAPIPPNSPTMPLDAGRALLEIVLVDDARAPFVY